MNEGILLFFGAFLVLLVIALLFYIIDTNETVNAILLILTNKEDGK
jgi:hypothetical protein